MMTVEELQHTEIIDTQNYNNKAASEILEVDELFAKDGKPHCTLVPNNNMGAPSTTSATTFPGSTAIISPIPLDNLPLNIIEQLKQKAGSAGLITSISPNSTTISPHLFGYPVQQQQQPQTPDSSSTNKKSSAAVKKTEDTNKARVLTPDERRQRRLLRNRLAAKDCRKKKKEYIEQMKEKIERLEKEQTELRNQIKDLKEQVASIPENKDDQVLVMMNSEDNYRLMKEVEELNAKLKSMK